MEKGHAHINGLHMYYEVHGQRGTPLILIHGGGSTIETSFGRILPTLSHDRQVIAADLVAHGRTSDRPGPSSFEQDADDIATLVRHLGVNKAHFLGFSNGGSTVMQIANRHPDLVSKLVVISAFYKREGLLKGFFEGMEFASLDNMPQPLKDAYLAVAPDPNGIQAMFDKDYNRMMTFTDWPDSTLTSIQASTLLIAGDHDVVRTEHVVAMSRLIPRADLMILPGIHGSFIGEICAPDNGSILPEMVARFIGQWLDQEEEGGTI